MKIELIGEIKTVMSNPHGKHNYFGWPTAVRLQSGKIAVVASGYRIDHVCPFGKAVIAYSEDEGKTFTSPAPVIDTVLDDRDAGIMTFGKTGVLLSSFNNSVAFQRDYAEKYTQSKYALAYLDTVTEAEEKAVLGATFRISHDAGVTFGPLYVSPVTSPHGPCECSDGSVLWVGTVFGWHSAEEQGTQLQAYRVDTVTGEMRYVGSIPDIPGLNSCEPHAVETEDGTIITHIRVQDGGQISGNRAYTVYQSESCDGGKTWTQPHQILSDFGGAPAHLLRTESGRLISSYGYREPPYGIRVAYSDDGGRTWERDFEVNVNGVSHDVGYPATVALADGSFLTVFYAHSTQGVPATILAQKWRFV